MFRDWPQDHQQTLFARVSRNFLIDYRLSSLRYDATWWWSRHITLTDALRDGIFRLPLISAPFPLSVVKYLLVLRISIAHASPLPTFEALDIRHDYSHSETFSQLKPS